MRRHQARLAAQVSQRLHARAARAQFSDAGVVRHVIPSVAVRLGGQHCGVVRQRLPVRFVVVNYADFPAGNLPEPDGGAVAYTQIPSRMHVQARLVVHCRDAARQLCLGHLAAVVGAKDGRLKAALKFLAVLFGRHLGPGGGQLALWQQTRLASPQHQGKPVRFNFRALVEVEKSVAAFRRADEHRPALPIGQRRADYLAPSCRRHVGVFIEDDAIEVEAAQPIVVVSAVKANARAIRQVSPQLGLVERNARHAAGELAHVGPGDVLGLHVKRCDVGITRVRLARLQRA